MAMKQKLGIGAIVMILALAISVGINALPSSSTSKGAKAIHISVIDTTKDKELYNETLYTDAQTLDVVVRETTSLTAVMKEDAYGPYELLSWG